MERSAKLEWIQDVHDQVREKEGLCEIKTDCRRYERSEGDKNCVCKDKVISGEFVFTWVECQRKVSVQKW